MRAYQAEGIVLKNHNLGNSDRIITIFSREHGKIRAAARGSRKTNSKFGGRLDVLAHNRYLLSKGRNLDILSQAESLQVFKKIRVNYGLIQSALYMLWLVDRITVDQQENKPVYDLLLSCLKALEQRPATTAPTIKAYFQRELLACEGLLAEGENGQDFEAKFFHYTGF